MRKIYFTLFLLCLVLCSGNTYSQTTTLNYTGSYQTYTVPSGCTTVLIDASGAGGGNSPCSTPGKGGRVVCSLAVSSGQVCAYM